MRMMISIGATILVLAGSAQAAGPVSQDPDDIIAARQAAFELMQGNVTAMKAAIDAGQPVKPYTTAAKAIAAWAKAIPKAFPAGTEAGHDTKAKAEVWSDQAGFIKAAAALEQSAGKLAVLADADDKAGFAEEFGAMGKTCGACHRGYRARN